MQIKFTENGESPDIGAFEKGDVKTVHNDIAQVMLQRGMAEEVNAHIKGAVKAGSGFKPEPAS